MSKNIPEVKFDRYDRGILEILQRSGRASNQEIADEIGLSPSPCLRRIRALEEAGYIDGYVALLNARQLNLTLASFVHISMDKHTPERFAEFERQVEKYPEVMECHLIVGQSADYLLKIVVKDMDAYHKFLLHRLTKIEGVVGVQSSFVLSSSINKTALPIPESL